MAWSVGSGGWRTSTTQPLSSWLTSRSRSSVCRGSWSTGRLVSFTVMLHRSVQWQTTFLPILRLLNGGVVLYSGDKTQTYDSEVNIKPLYLEFNSADTHVHISFTVCVCECVYTHIIILIIKVMLFSE